jgi:hypothetical protein
MPHDLDDIRKGLEEIRAVLPTSIEASAFKTRSKIPFKALCCRAGLLWRFDELGRAACDSCDRGDVVAAMVLTRALIETACKLWHLRELIARQVDNGVESNFDELMVRLLVGNKIEGPTEAINVLTLIDRADATFPRIRYIYDNLSESAHPNYDGTGGAFSKIDSATNVVRFGRRMSPANFGRLAVLSMAPTVLVARRAYDGITDLMPKFIERCEQALSPDL